jgi:pyridoxine kinase
LFASILAADALNGVPFPDSVKKAADFVALCIRGTEEAGVPLLEGVLFERYLSRLIQWDVPAG